MHLNFLMFYCDQLINYSNGHHRLTRNKRNIQDMRIQKDISNMNWSTNWTNILLICFSYIQCHKVDAEQKYIHFLLLVSHTFCGLNSLSTIIFGNKKTKRVLGVIIPTRYLNIICSLHFLLCGILCIFRLWILNRNKIFIINLNSMEFSFN